MSKNMLLACPATTGDRIETFAANIEKWLRSTSLESLAQSFGGSEIPSGSVRETARWYEEFSDRWDFRGKQNNAFDCIVGEGARWLLSNDGLTQEQRDLTLEAALHLGLRDNSTTECTEAEYIWVLGGAKLSCKLRSRLAIDVIGDEHNNKQTIVLLSSFRPIGDAEREATNTYAPYANTEFDLCVAAAQCELGVGEKYDESGRKDDINKNSSWAIRKYEYDRYDVIVMAAPSSEPDIRRANSADTYDFFFSNFDVKKDATILLTTSQIYVPYQHSEAVRTVALPYGIYLDTIGFPIEWGGSLQGMNEPTNYLQEIRSTILAINRFILQHDIP